MFSNAAQRLRTTIVPLAVGAGLGVGIAVGASAVALSPAAATAVNAVMNTVTSCSSNSACITGANSKTGAGVEGTSTSGNGVTGMTSGNKRSGVYAVGGRKSYGVYASGGTGGYFTSTYGNAALMENTFGNTNSAVFAIGGSPAGNGNFVLDVASSDFKGYMLVDDSGSEFISGEIYTEGECVNGCVQSRVRSYAPRESAPTMEDVGKGKLVGGSASVALDPAFANVVDTTSDYAILLTPEGDSNGLYIAERTPRGFVVRENRGGHSTVTFSYRIVAKPFGKAEPRLPMVALHSAARPASAAKLGRPDLTP